MPVSKCELLGIVVSLHFADRKSFLLSKQQRQGAEGWFNLV